MDINIDWEEFRKRRLFVATPMYGGQCAGEFTKSLLELVLKCQANNMHCQTFFLFNESLITRGRNYLVDEFLRSDCTHMLFIDADIGFKPDDALALLALQSDESPYDVITATYPKKVISWEKVKVAVDKGYGDEDPNNLANYVGDFVFNPIQSPCGSRIDLDKPVEIAEGGTGFMMIRRATFDKYAEGFPGQRYRPDHSRSDQFDGSRDIVAFFDCIIDPVSRRYLSEDYMFCHNVRRIGMKVWLCPWIRLNHMGSYSFGGSLANLAEVGVDATAHMVQDAKQKKRAK